MRRIVPEAATVQDGAHIVLGSALAVIAVIYFVANIVDGRWRQHFPWAAGNLSEVQSDLKAIIKLKIPSAGGAGLFSAIQGLLLLLLIATAVSGLGWLLADGSRAALSWRQWHMLVANTFAWLFVLHIVTVLLHLVAWVRD